VIRTHWLLDVEIDGQEYRWSVDAVEVETADGDTLRYSSGLRDPELAVGEFGAEVEVVDDSVDWPALAPQLDGRRVVLRRWIEGTSLEQAEVYANGEATDVLFGARSESVAWAISDVPGSETSLGVQVPDPLARIDATTWPITGGATLCDEGAMYPVLFGYPGYTGAATPIPVMPAPMGQFLAAATTYLVLSEDADAPITQARIRNDTEDTEATETVVTVTDLLGRRIKVNHFTLAAGPAPGGATEQREMFAGFVPAGGGGVARSAYDVIVYLLRRWGAASVDWARLPEVRDVLGQFLVDTWIDDTPPDPWAWIEAVLLPDLPVEVRTSVGGRYLVTRRYTSDPGRRVGTIEVGIDAERVSGVSRAASEGPANEFTGLYRASTRGDWLGRIILTGNPATIGSAPKVTVPPATTTQLVSVATSALCRRSHARYQLRQSEPIEIDWTWDTGTVLRCLELRAERDALPGLSVELEIEDGEDLVEGDELLVTDEELGWSDRVAIVDGPPVRGDRTTALLRLPE
jgi:hypothetical protein